MKKALFGLVLAILSTTLCDNSRASALMSEMEICVASNKSCVDVPLSSVPTISTADQFEFFYPFIGKEVWALLFGDASGATYAPPAGETWTLIPTLAWDGTSISRPIYCVGTASGGGVCSVGFEMDLPTEDGPGGGQSILFDLSAILYDESGNTVASTTGNYFNLFTPVPEPSALWLVLSGLVAFVAQMDRASDS